MVKLMHHDDQELRSLWEGWHWDGNKDGWLDPELCAKATREEVEYMRRHKRRPWRQDGRSPTCARGWSRGGCGTHCICQVFIKIHDGFPCVLQQFSTVLEAVGGVTLVRVVDAAAQLWRDELQLSAALLSAIHASTSRPSYQSLPTPMRSPVRTPPGTRLITAWVPSPRDWAERPQKHGIEKLVMHCGPRCVCVSTLVVRSTEWLNVKSSASNCFRDLNCGGDHNKKFRSPFKHDPVLRTALEEGAVATRTTSTNAGPFGVPQVCGIAFCIDSSGPAIVRPSRI